MAILENGKILFIERRGKVKLYNPISGSIKVVSELEVYTEFEDGLMGLTLDPNFQTNNWIYLYYSHPKESRQHLSRFDFRGDSLDFSSEIVLLEVPTQREECCHTGGSLTWDSNGNLYLSTGDNTNPFESGGYGPMDEREGRSSFDAQSSSANPNDLRGKILRIHPEDDGSYTIPEGNLFSQVTEGTRPEIYVMGNRNPYRISVDKRTGFLYWGEVGPDAGEDSLGRGPRGYDEVNQAREAGNFGWPLFVADNKAYNDYDFESNKCGSPFDPKSPKNTSPNNTGIIDLPPAQSAFIWYPYAKSDEYPLVGEGGRNAMAGPIYYSSDFDGPDSVLPSYFDGKLFIYDWMRGWIFAVSMKENGEFVSMEPFMPNTEFNNPMDMELGPDGVLYMLEYGSSWYTQNKDARLVRIDYNGGNRPPITIINANITKGQIPLQVNFNSEGSVDYDNDELTFSWEFGDGTTSDQQNPAHEYSEAGIYDVVMTIRDSEGNTSLAALEIWAGNSPPMVDINVEGNKTFFWNENPIQYVVEVQDEEDGRITRAGNEEGQAWINIDVLEEGFDETEIILGHRAPLKTLEGKKLIDGSDCLACHKLVEKSIGPEYVAVAEKYKDDENAVSYLADKIINGGGGVWGDQAMAAHPQLSQEDAEKMVDYILSLKSSDQEGVLPLIGNYHPLLLNPTESSKLIIRASYADRGSGNIPSIIVEEQMVLRSPIVTGQSISEGQDYDVITFEGKSFTVLNHGGWFSFDGIDFEGIEQISINTVVPEGSDSKFVISQDTINGGQMISIDLKEMPGPGPQAGMKFASARVQINSLFFGTIVCSIDNDSNEEIIGALISLEFKR